MADSEFRLPDGTWCCVRDGVTEPCGDCGGCDYVAAVNAANAEFLGDVGGYLPTGVVRASNETGIHEIVIAPDG
jgi:hypothetical protein